MKAALAGLAACCAVHLGVLAVLVGWAGWSWPAMTAIGVAAAGIALAGHHRRRGCRTVLDSGSIR